MKPKKKMKKLRITDLAEHGGRPVSFRTALHKSKKVYDRKRLKRAGIEFKDGCSFRLK